MIDSVQGNVYGASRFAINKERDDPMRILSSITILAVLSGLACAPTNVQGQESAPKLGPPAVEFSPLVQPRMLPANSAPVVRPQYHMNLRLDTACGKLSGQQKVLWTNPGPIATSEIVFRIYANYRPTPQEIKVYERTIEAFRLDPKTAIDREGRRITFQTVTTGGQPAPFAVDNDNDTVLRVKLPAELAPGDSAEITLEFAIQLPPVQGRLGQYQGVTNLLNWYPIVPYFGAEGWDTPPYIAWHQPWHNEAGDYRVTLTIPSGELIATGGQLVSETPAEPGWKTVTIHANGLRDLAIVASKRYEVHEQNADGVRIRLLAFPENRAYAQFLLKTATECIPRNNQWFGAYPYPDFTIAESYFGWNGNETGGMVLIDQRVFAAPQIGHRYVEHLITHEILHQWWYGVVGTDGHRESWMDESLVSYLTELSMRKKYGADFKLLDWPKVLNWLPNISYHSLQHSGYPLFDGRGGKGRSLATLPEIGHIYNLFFLVYDRGALVFSMISQRMGEEAFFQFLREVYAKHRFQILHYQQFKEDLEAFSGQDWTEFLDNWLRSAKTSDWDLDDAKVTKLGDNYRTTVVLRQRRELNEPVEIAFQASRRGEIKGRALLAPAADGSVSITAAPGCPDVEWKARRLDNCRWEIEFDSPEAPKQVVVDPDRRVVDTNRFNNRWRFDPEVRFTPLFTPLDEAPVFQPMDRSSVVLGPSLDQEGRLGVRSSLMHANRFRVSPFVAYTGNDAQMTAGVDAVWYNAPAPNFSIGLLYEHTLLTGLYNDPQDQGRLYLRYTFAYTSSYIYDNLGFVETYFRFGDNFFPDEDFRAPTNPRVEDYRRIRAVGAWLHINTQMPYWNPEKGVRFDANYEYGFPLFDRGDTFHRTWAQASAVRKLPEWLGPISEIRGAARLAGGVGAPDNGEHFRFGGPLRFRGQRSEDTQGNAFWLASAETRFPLLSRVDRQVLDNVISWKALWASMFYDVGESYLLERSQGVDHAVGAGLHFQLGLISFVEILTVRVEVAKSLATDSSVAWFGLYQAF